MKMPVETPVGTKIATIDGTTQIEGESYALGWNAAANYAFDDKNEIGVVYRSRIKHSLEADLKGYNTKPDLMGGGDVFGNAYGVVTLPDSWDIGYNHKFDKKTRLELKATRTNWSTYDALNVYFDKSLVGIPGIAESSPSAKNWSNGWRYAIGLEHNFSDKYAAMAGFAFDESSIPYDVPVTTIRNKPLLLLWAGWMSAIWILQVMLPMLIRALMLTTALPRLLLFPTNVNSNFIF